MRKLLLLIGVTLALLTAAFAGRAAATVRPNMPVGDGYACHAPYNLGDPNWYTVGATYPYRISGNYTVAYANPYGPYIIGSYYWEPNSMYCGWQSYIGGYAWIAL